MYSTRNPRISRDCDCWRIQENWSLRNIWSSKVLDYWVKLNQTSILWFWCMLSVIVGENAKDGSIISRTFHYRCYPNGLMDNPIWFSQVGPKWTRLSLFCSKRPCLSLALLASFWTTLFLVGLFWQNVLKNWHFEQKFSSKIKENRRYFIHLVWELAWFQYILGFFFSTKSDFCRKIKKNVRKFISNL